MTPPKNFIPWNKGILQWEYQKHPMLGKHHSEESLEKMRRNHWSKRGYKPWNKGKIIVERIQKTCPTCKITFFVLPFRSKQKYCSVKCGNAVPWNKNKKCPQLSEALKGRKAWSKGLTKETDIRVALYAKKLKGIKKPSLVGVNNPSKRPQIREKLRILNLGERNPMYGKKLPLWQKNMLIKASLDKRKDKDFVREWNKKVSLALKNKAKSISHRNKIREARLKQIFPKKDTQIEVKLQSALKNETIAFETHKPILNVCQTDIFIRPNICIFCDGDWWHANPELYDRNNLKSQIQVYNVKKDELHNQILQQNNYVVLRFWECDIINNIEGCTNQIKELTGVRE